MKILFTLLLLCCLVLTVQAQPVIIPLPGAGLTALHTGKNLLAVTYTDGIAIITPTDGSIVQTLKTSDHITTVVWAPDGISLVFGCEDGSLRLWKLAASTAQIFPPAKTAITALAWSNDGKQIIVGTASGILEQRDGQSGKTIRTLKSHHTAIACITWQKEELCSVDIQGKIIRWNSNTGTTLSVIELQNPITTAMWSPDGNALFVADIKDAVIHHFTTKTEVSLENFAKTGIRAASWDAHSSFVATADFQGEIALWDAVRGIEPYPATNHTLFDNLQSLTLLSDYHIAITNKKDVILYDLTMTTDVPASLAYLPALRVYPNPMAHNGIVQLSLLTTTQVQLTITDVQGREILTLCNERLPAGDYTYTLNNFITTPGIYVLQLITPQGQTTRPLIIVR